MVAFPEFIKKRSLFCRVIGNDRHYIIVHLVLLQQLHGMHDPRKCILSSGILAIPVMHFLWTIQRQPYQKTMRSQKTRPFLIYQQTIGLYRVFDLQFFIIIFLLQFHCLLKKIQPCQRWLTPLKCKGE